MLKFRNSGADERDKYFQSVEDRRAKATKDQVDKWAWQKKQYKKGEDRKLNLSSLQCNYII